MSKQFIPKSTLQRLPLYLNHLKCLPLDVTTISATAIAEGLGFHHVQVRKDLASVSSGGRPKVGYMKADLIQDLERFFTRMPPAHAVVVGMGLLGQSLVLNNDFKAFGFKVVAAFDYNERMVGRHCGDIQILPISRLYDFCNAGGIRLGIITAEADVAQEVCDTLTESGAISIWNFSPIPLVASEEVMVYHENLTGSIAALASHIMQSK